MNKFNPKYELNHIASLHEICLHLAKNLAENLIRIYYVSILYKLN